MIEQWKVVAEYPNYEVSNQGRLRRLKTNNNAVAGRILKANIGSAGYPMVNLLNEAGRRHLSVHRLVATAFLERAEGANEVNHIDSNRANNLATNLEWVTSSANRLHAYRSGGLSAKGESNGYSKLTEAGVREIRSHGSLPRALQDSLATSLGVSMATVRDVAARRTWAHI
ncbi:NUMOD4 domain-containing protein [Pseudomonas sp.]|uniref:NUMOD4 domain-containing protein n=1 Tax=Pseudomonas sp. TaxID=306 RepID=UPI0025856503|nr:NUMOD4 domain-containing protein [Pseudomonas sp.]